MIGALQFFEDRRVVCASAKWVGGRRASFRTFGESSSAPSFQMAGFRRGCCYGNLIR